ncbi:MAG: MATE family efflux transporter, partial [Flavisolibacter sp.]|nr:MATE family efflux transporter [Flavisolibacter sp.]
GFGMQNRVGEMLAVNNFQKAREFVSITYKYTFIIACCLFILGWGASFFVDWNALFNSSIPASELKTITAIAFIAFLVSFVAGNLQQVLNAANKTSVPKLLGLITNACIILLLVIVRRSGYNNLILAALALALPNPLIYLAANYFFYRKELRHLKPQWQWKNRESVRNVLGLGVKFFILQITTLVIYQTDTIIVTQYLGPSEVTPYNLANRYFYFIYFIFSLAITPYWPAFTEAYVKNDFHWISKSLKRLINACFIATAATFLMFWVAFYFIPVWSRHSFNIYHYIPLLITSACYVILMFFNSVLSTFLNATSKLNIQLSVQVLLSLISIPTAILFIKKFGWGSAGVNGSIIIVQLVYLVICGWYTRKHLRHKILEQQASFQSAHTNPIV